MNAPCFRCGCCGLFGLALAAAAGWVEAGEGWITQAPANHAVTVRDGTGQLSLRLRYDRGCRIEALRVGGREVLAPSTGGWTGLKSQGAWYTTLQTGTSPLVHETNNTLTVSNLAGGGGGVTFRETWRFTPLADRIVWRIEREYLSGGLVEDIALAGWDFAEMSTWTGGLLAHGGVAWTKLFDRPDATYAVHGGTATLWHRDDPVCLRIELKPAAGQYSSTRFTRLTNGVFTLVQGIRPERPKPLHGQHRFLKDRQDVWAPGPVQPGMAVVEVTLQVLDRAKTLDRGTLPAMNPSAVREILNTIARIGAIDDDEMGSNGYYSGYAVLHEPWIAQLGLAIDDPGYFEAYTRTLDHQRDHAIGPDGRVKSRWSYTAGDAMPGTYDSHGYYECQWGWLMDSQPSYVINVAEQFGFTGDLAWVRTHKESAERALAFLLNRDADGDGLVEMMTDSHRQAKGSDWIDVIWAAHENAFVNAQLYHALDLWAEVEEVLGDGARAADYRQRARRLQTQFNASTTDGGFWHEPTRRFIYWRDRDDSLHGLNLVVPVNFMAIAYDLCQPPERARAVLDQIEARMQQERLFFWPLCFDSYQEGEGAAWQFPFPVYENGDIFLAWGETGTRAYARYQPAIAVKYVRNVLSQYEQDGLAFQRYLRKTQRGEGDDILANNASSVVGLYRNLYGIQPQWNRLYLEPHLTPELDGTRFTYWLRGQTYEIDLRVADYRLSVDNFTLRSSAPFAVRVEPEQAQYYHGASRMPSLDVRRPSHARFELQIQAWSEDPVGERTWTLLGGEGRPPTELGLRIHGLKPDTEFRLERPGQEALVLRSDSGGTLPMRQTVAGDRAPRRFALRAVTP